jgi:UDP-3-O-[3-hydroxymyristoyl] N-acetylglucosamine deacetylase
MSKTILQKTVSERVTVSGTGVHSGKKTSLTINPAPANHGIKFQRSDLPGTQPIQALFKRVVDTSLATVLGNNGAIVSTIEHLMASFTGLGIDNALIEVDDYEIPIMDGSAAVFAQALKKAGLAEQDAPKHFFIIKKPIKVNEGDKSVIVLPG